MLVCKILSVVLFIMALFICVLMVQRHAQAAWALICFYWLIVTIKNALELARGDK